MKKIICIIVCLCMCMMSLAPVCGAEGGFSGITIDYDRDTGAVNIEGKAEFSKNEDEPVRLIVLKPDTDVKKFISGELTFMDCGVYADETELTDGKFTFDQFTIPTDSPLGSYIVRIATDGVVEDKLTIPVASRQNTIDAMDNASKEKVESNIASYNDVYLFDMGEGSVFYSLEADKKQGVYEMLANRTYADLATLQLEFKRACLLQKIYQGPWGAVSSILAGDDAKLLTLDTTDYKNNLTPDEQDNVCTALAKNLYDNVTLLKEAFDGFVEAEMNPDEGGSSPSPDRGGRGDKPGSGVVISTPNVNNNISGNNQSQSKEIFYDLQNHSWAKASIEKLYNKGIINGKSDTSFAPDDLLTRAEAVKIIVLAFFDVKADAKCSFTDVLENSWAYPYVATAYELGVINGYEDNRAGANDNITREDFSVMIVRAASLAGVKLGTGEATEFSDGAAVSSYAKEAVAALSSAGIINGVGDGQFAPKNNATRAQAAKIVAGLI